jgi:ribose transport system substrate-binding protein
MKKNLTRIVMLLVVVSLFVVFPLAGCSRSKEEVTETTAMEGGEGLKDEYRFVMIPIVVQTWFDIVHRASVEAADILGEAMGTTITVELASPKEADVVVQNQILEQSIASKPDGIVIDAIDVQATLPILQEAQSMGIAVAMYVSKTPDGVAIPYISNDFYEQGGIVFTEFIKKLGTSGKIAIIQGVPTNTAHAERYQAYQDLLPNYPNIEVVAEAFDYDDLGTAQTEAAKILSAHPDLDGFLVVDAAGPVGVGLAIKEANRVGDVVYVGIDDLPQLQQLMLDGVLDLSIATRPRAIGQWSTVVLMMQNLGISPAFWYDTRVGWLTSEMVEEGGINQDGYF